MEGCRFQDVAWVDCKIVGADFFKCDPTFFTPTFKKSTLYCCNFSDLNLKNISFEVCKLKECYFTNACLKDAFFGESDLSGTIFHNTDLSKADFSTASNYYIDPRTNVLKNAKFSLPEAVGLLKGLDIKLV